MSEHGHEAPEITADAQVARVFAWRRGFNAMHVIDLGVRLGLFEALAEAPGLTADALAARLGLHPPYVGIWCTTAYGFALLDADGARRFRLAPHITEILATPQHPRYLGGYVRLGTEFASEDFRRAPDAFRTGRTVPFQGRSEAFAEVVAEAIAGMNTVLARKIIPQLPGLAVRLEEGIDALEVGCGTGRLQVQLARTYPKCRFTGVDIDPIGIAAAREAVRKAAVADRVTLLEGDVSLAVPAESQDLVLMVEVLHEIAPSMRSGVLAGCAQALRPRGWLVIVDETYPSTLEQAREPEYLFPLQTGFEEMLWGNLIPTREEQERLLRDAGFAKPIERSLLGEGFTLLRTQR